MKPIKHAKYLARAGYPLIAIGGIVMKYDYPLLAFTLLGLGAGCVMFSIVLSQ